MPSPQWLEKLLQLYQVQILRHGVMMVGPSGSGKTSSWQVLIKALEMLDGIKTEVKYICCIVLSCNPEFNEDL